MKRASNTPTSNEILLTSTAAVRFAISNYLDIQERRKRADMQLRHLGDKDNRTPESGLPQSHGAYLVHEAEAWAGLENELKRVLKKYAAASSVGCWMMSLRGVGEVIAAGMLAHIDITKSKTAGAVWRYAGLDPTAKWEAGQKRPFNAHLKQLCYHFGECQVKVYKHPDAFYGHLYAAKKEQLIRRNECGGFAEKAKVYKGVSDPANKKLLAQGKVPPAYLDKMSKRFAAKIFLSHLYGIMHFLEYGTVPLPFAHAHLGHIHLHDVPNHEMFPGFIEAYHGNKVTLEAAE